MNLRSLLFDNLPWKLLSVSLALLIWSGTRMFVRQEIQPLGHPLSPIARRDFRNLPIRILSNQVAQQPLRVEPSSVFVQVGGDMSTLEHLTEEDALVYVEILTPSQRTTTNRVEVRVPSNVRVLSVVPEHVVIIPQSSP